MMKFQLGPVLFRFSILLIFSTQLLAKSSIRDVGVIGGLSTVGAMGCIADIKMPQLLANRGLNKPIRVKDAAGMACMAGTISSVIVNYASFWTLDLTSDLTFENRPLTYLWKQTRWLDVLGGAGLISRGYFKDQFYHLAPKLFFAKRALDAVITIPYVIVHVDWGKVLSGSAAE